MTDTNIHALPIGHTFDGYRILRLLGAGGFGITYLAEEVQIGRKVAIKEYLPQGFAARAADSFTVRAVSTSAQTQFAWGLDRFRKEASTLVAFEHPNIVSVYRYFEDNGTAYLVMQYVEGKPLDALIAGGKTLAESEIEEVILPILDGLEQVHAAHFLHRDIKPANIYIRKDGRPVLLDFGAARQAFGSETKSITAIVSEGYAPFEQYEAKGDQGPWTDVYALGAVIYRCIAGDRPPAAPERVSARLRGTADPMAPAREAGAGRYSARILEAADRALSVMPADRPQDIAALRELLKAGGPSRVASGSAPSAVVQSALASGATITAGPAAAKTKSRVPLLAGGAGAVAAAAVAAYFLLAPQPPTNSAAAPGAPSAPAEAADAAAERAAQDAAAKAEADLASLTTAIQRGELARGKTELSALRTRIDEALKKRPNHAGLRRVDAEARAAETDLGLRIAARVKELGDAAERGAADGDTADRRVAEIEQLDPAAAKTARERVDQLRRAAREKALDGEKARADAEKRRAEEAKRIEEERRARQAQAELHLSLARYHLDQAMAAAREKRYAEARRTLEQAGVQLGRAAELNKGGPEPATVATVRRDIAAFQRDLSKKIDDRIAELNIELVRLVAAEKYDEALRLLDEAEELDPGSTTLAHLRKTIETERKQAEERHRREAEQEQRKKQEAARAADPDAAERERTRGIVRGSAYDAAGRRGTAYFGFGENTLAGPALAALQRGADAARADAKAHLTVLCGYDQLEAKEAADGRKLAQQRCAAAYREAQRRGLPAARIRSGFSAPGRGPDFRRVAFVVQTDKPPETAKSPEPASRPGAYQLAGRTGSLSRISPERRAVMRIHLQFGSGGTMGVSCVAELADGGQSGCFGATNGSGTWSLSGTSLCLASGVINLASRTCYQMSGSGNQIVLSGPGLLAGAMFLR